MDWRFVSALLSPLFYVMSPAHAGVMIHQELVRLTGTHVAGEVPASVNPAAYTSMSYVREPTAYVDGETRTSFAVADDAIGRGIAFTVSEGAYDTASGPPGTLAALGPGSSPLQFESSANHGGNGTEQGGARSLAWGFDTETGSTIRNAALIFTLLGSPDPIHYFGFDSLDLEGGNARSAYAVIYDALGLLIESRQLDFSFTEQFGNNNVRHFSFVSGPNDPLAFVALFVGDDDGGNGHSERIAAANFLVGTRLVTPVPLPATLPLFAVGLFTFFWLRRARA